MAARKAASKYVVEDAPASNAGRPELEIPELEEFASDWANNQVPVLSKGKGIAVPMPTNVAGNGNADIALVRHHLKRVLAKQNISKDDYTTFTKDGVVFVTRIR